MIRTECVPNDDQDITDLSLYMFTPIPMMRYCTIYKIPTSHREITTVKLYTYTDEGSYKRSRTIDLILVSVIKQLS